MKQVLVNSKYLIQQQVFEDLILFVMLVLLIIQIYLF